MGKVTGLLLIFEPDNLERDLELSTAFSWESFVYLTLTELFPVASLANISLISLERLHATLFLFRHCLVGKRDYLIIILCSWLFSLTLSSVIALLYLRLSLANPYVNASHTFLTLVDVTVSYVIIISTVKNNPPSPNAGLVLSTERKLTVTLFIVTVVPFLTILSRTILQIIPPHMSSSKACPEIFYRIDYFFFALYLFSYIVNTVIYAVRMQEFRKAARKLVLQRR